MQIKRLRKQVAYALGFLAFWVLVIGGPLTLWSDRSPRSTPTPVPTSPVQPVEVQSVDVIRHENVVDVVARLHNPNARVGIAHFRATFVLWDNQDQEAARVPVDSHILPGSIQYVSALNVPADQAIARVTLVTPTDPAYISLSPTIPLPSFSTFLVERATIRQGGNPTVEQKGVVTNNSAFDWQHVEVTALAFDEANRVIGVGKTFVGRLVSGEQREFTIQWPASAVPLARVVTLATTNIFKEDNIIQAVGDPSQLR